MGNFKELNLEEISLVSGGGNAGDHESASSRSLNGAGGGYGAIPNIDVYGMTAAGKAIAANKDCLGSMALGTANALVAARTGSYAGYATTVASALSDVNSTCNKSSGAPFR